MAIGRAGGKVAPVPYTHRASYRVALENGQGVTEFEPNHSAANEIRGVWKWLKTELGIARQRQERAA